MAFFSPNKSFQYLEDGDVGNLDALLLNIRKIDASLNLTLESAFETAGTPVETPLNAEPGQAWFVADRCTLETVGDEGLWGQIFDPGAAVRGNLLICFVAETPTETEARDGQWVSIPVPTTAYGYIKDRGARYQFDPVTELWQVQSTLIRFNYSVSFEGGFPIEGSPEAAKAYPIMTVPEAISIQGITMQYSGEDQGTYLDPAGIFPKISYSTSSDPPDTIALYGNGIVSNGAVGWPSGGTPQLTATEAWRSGTLADASQFPTTVPAGASLAFGGWTDTGTTSEIRRVTFTITALPVI